MFFIIFAAALFILVIGFAFSVGKEEGAGSGVGAFFLSLLVAAMVLATYMMVSVAITDPDIPTDTTEKTYDLTSFSEYGGGESGGLYVTVEGESDTISFVLDGEIRQEDEENVTIVTSDRLKVTKTSGTSTHIMLHPFTFDTADTYTLYVPRTAVDFTDN
jgi:hypothetical protein